jgi:hypothetical protein
MLKKAENALPTPAARKHTRVCTVTYRAATGRERSLRGLFRDLLVEIEERLGLRFLKERAILLAVLFWDDPGLPIPCWKCELSQDDWAMLLG